MKTANKDVNKLINNLVKCGWEYVNRSNHPLLISPNGKKIFVSSSPSDKGYLRVLKGRIKRALR